MSAHGMNNDDPCLRAGLAWPGNGKILRRLALLICLLPVAVAFAAAPEGPQQQANFALVNDEPILQSTFETALRIGAKRRFYHGRAPQAELEAYRQQVGQQLVDQMLLHQEALRRGIQPDPQQLQLDLVRSIEPYVDTPGWEEQQEQILPLLCEGLARSDRIRQLEEQLQAEVQPPSEAQLLAYYRANPETFTSPPRSRASLILLKVPAWAEAGQWQDRLEEMRRVREKIQNGLSFADAARRYSEDDTAAAGGDMGYLHQGMLGRQAEQAVADLAVDSISEPITLLEGIGLFHLLERQPARLNPLAQVRERARELWLREQRAQAVEHMRQHLRRQAVIRYANPADSIAGGLEEDARDHRPVS